MINQDVKYLSPLHREVYFMKFLKLPNSCFRNDEIMEKLLRLFFKQFIHSFKLLIFHTISKKS